MITIGNNEGDPLRYTNYWDAIVNMASEPGEYFLSKENQLVLYNDREYRKDFNRFVAKNSNHNNIKGKASNGKVLLAVEIGKGVLQIKKIILSFKARNCQPHANYLTPTQHNKILLLRIAHVHDYLNKKVEESKAKDDILGILNGNYDDQKEGTVNWPDDLPATTTTTTTNAPPPTTAPPPTIPPTPATTTPAISPVEDLSEEEK